MRHTTLISCCSVALLALGLAPAAFSNDAAPVELSTPEGKVTVTSGQPTAPVAQDEPHSVAALDTNGDGSISKSEAASSIALTNEFDLADNWNPPKRDGRITSAELRSWLARGGDDGGATASTTMDSDDSLDTETAATSTVETTSDGLVESTDDDMSSSDSVAEQDDSDLEPGDAMDSDDEAINDDEMDGDQPDIDEPNN